jgi:membrane-associated HD superfamily phosphohydrolase
MTIGADAASAVPAFADNMNRALGLLIDKVSSGMDAATSFLAEQIPDVLHQLLLYNFVVNLLWTILGTVILVGIIVVWILFVKEAVKKYDETEDDDYISGIIITTIIGLVIGVADIFGILSDHFGWLEIWLAPKIWLIEYATQLIKTATGH